MGKTIILGLSDPSCSDDRPPHIYNHLLYICRRLRAETGCSVTFINSDQPSRRAQRESAMNAFVSRPNHPSLLPHPSQPTYPWTAQRDQDTSDQENDGDNDHDEDGGDKQVKRRSSKACDQCRKSKCKCERSSSAGEPCRNCVLLGTGEYFVVSGPTH